MRSPLLSCSLSFFCCPLLCRINMSFWICSPSVRLLHIQRQSHRTRCTAPLCHLIITQPQVVRVNFDSCFHNFYVISESTIHFRLELSPGEPRQEEGLATFYRDKEAAGCGKLRKEQLSIYIDWAWYVHATEEASVMTSAGYSLHTPIVVSIIPGRVLRESANQLSDRHLQHLWVKSPHALKKKKKTITSYANDYRPVALTTIVMKCSERLLKKNMTASS